MSDRKATPKGLETMKELVQGCMDAGAFGLSTGLIYPPCSYGDTEELIELNREWLYRTEFLLFISAMKDIGC
jgi:N-acyl-D-amino-acid deacylase